MTHVYRDTQAAGREKATLSELKRCRDIYWNIKEV